MVPVTAAIPAKQHTRRDHEPYYVCTRTMCRFCGNSESKVQNGVACSLKREPCSLRASHSLVLSLARAPVRAREAAVHVFLRKS